MEAEYDAIILGAGAAGLAAGLYTTRAMLKTVILESLGPGGQLLITDEIENYPGFPQGVKGQELAQMMEQADYPVRRRNRLHRSRGRGEPRTSRSRSSALTTRNIPPAASSSPPAVPTTSWALPARMSSPAAAFPTAPSAMATFSRGQDVVVVGGGDAAMDESYYLSGIVNSVTIIHRRDELRATKVLQERAFASPKFKWLWSHVVEEFTGHEALEHARVKNLKTGEVYDYPTAAAFIYVGFHPNTEYLKGLVDMDALGHIYTDIHMRTKTPGLYACGDARADSTRQLGAAVGDGITAALAAYHDLSG